MWRLWPLSLGTEAAEAIRALTSRRRIGPTWVDGLGISVAVEHYAMPLGTTVPMPNRRLPSRLVVHAENRRGEALDIGSLEFVSVDGRRARIPINELPAHLEPEQVWVGSMLAEAARAAVARELEAPPISVCLTDIRGNQYCAPIGSAVAELVRQGGDK